MQKIDKTRSLTPGDDRSRAWKAISLYTGASLSDLVIFDIETTGLSANVSSLYLIGALWYDTPKKEIKMCQWFADDYTSECTILEAFSSFVSGFSTVAHYNGSGFDIPYLEKKYRFHHLENPFAALRSFDIYREVRKEKTLFDSSSLKLSVVEKLVGFLRADNYSGKECIQIYSEFMQQKIFRSPQAEKEKEKLLLHNADDLRGTLLSSLLLYYKLPLHFSDKVWNADTLCITCQTQESVPFPCGRETEDFILSFEEKNACITLFCTEGCYCHFYENYKDYFYLPEEDTAIHKSVGIYVEKGFREPAKASNCYLKKAGKFVRFPASSSDYLTRHGLTLFRENYRTKPVFVLKDEIEKQDSLFWEEVLPYITSV